MTFSPLAAHARRVEFEAYGRRMDRRDAAVRAAKANRFPEAVARDLLGRWQTTRDADGFNAATRELNHHVRDVFEPMIARAPASLARFHAERIGHRDVLDRNASDTKVRAWAQRRAGEAGGIFAHNVTDEARHAALVTYTEAHGIEPAESLASSNTPPELCAVFLRGACLRMVDEQWWRRRARRMLTRKIEGDELRAGRVHCRAGVYLSDLNVTRGVDAARRNAETLGRTEAVNGLGEVFNLGELAEKSLSNPRLAFAEMMVRVKGLEQIADKLGWIGTFETWSLASHWHARLKPSGAVNPKWTGEGPREGQGYLRRQWAKVRATVRRLSIPFFGLRVAEPHHDGTPHWHMLMWTPMEWLGQLRDVLRRFALQDSPDEPGARKFRYKSETIDKAKGSAAGYLVKYVAKNTCADGLERALDTGDDGRDYDVGAAADNALRARLWARAHGIRQFQFFGSPAIGVWREFRRMREPVTADDKPTWSPTQLELFERARGAADESRYGDFVEACGGIDGHRFELHKVDAGDNVYGEPGRDVVKGIVFAMGGTPVVTRVHEWTILQGAQKSEVAAPWTRVSNCNGGEKPQGVMCGDEEKSGEENGCSKGQGDRYRTHGSGRGDHAYSPPPRRQEDDGRAGR